MWDSLRDWWRGFTDNDMVLARLLFRSGAPIGEAVEIRPGVLKAYRHLAQSNDGTGEWSI